MTIHPALVLELLAIVPLLWFALSSADGLEPAELEDDPLYDEELWRGP